MIPRKRITTLFNRGLLGLVAILASGAAAFVLASWLSPLPANFLAPPHSSTVVLDAKGGVLLDVVSIDEERSLPISIEDAGRWLPLAVVATEDEAFFNHPGVDPTAILGAARANIAAGRIVRGGSTITMQVAGIRLNHPRTFGGKLVEAFRALQIEAHYDKPEILEAWLNLAPFGGNSVGAEAGARRWFGKAAKDLSLSEAALLAGLPNSPERFRPDRFAKAALARRAIVLNSMRRADLISEQQHAAASAQPILLAQAEPPDNRAHVGWMASKYNGGAGLVGTTIDPELQAIAETLSRRHMAQLPDGLDVALGVVDLETSGLSAAIGSADSSDPRDGQVNGLLALRSPGSALKPFVYAAAFEAERLSPDSIVADAPLEVSAWRARNIDRKFLGPITCAQALQSSRNTPAIRVARSLGLPSVLAMMRRVGLSLPSDARDRAGLALVVGGIEVQPLELLEAYATLARGGLHTPTRLLADAPAPARRVMREATATAIERSLAGPYEAESAIMPFVCAKTGTSSGQRDATAAGWNARYAVVVWVGRFDGAGDASLQGATAALPLLRAILEHPSFATIRPLRAATHVRVRRPLAGLEAITSPRIIEPRDGDRLLAFGDTAMVYPRLSDPTEKAVLLLNGRPIKKSNSQSGIALPCGDHELRLLIRGESPHAIKFQVIGH